MAQWQTRDLSVDEAAAFLGVSGSTIRRRLNDGELRSVKMMGGERLVRMAPLEDTLRLADAAALLGVATSTARAACARGELTGKRVDGRWRVRLVSVLEDPRCRPEAVETFGGAPLPRSAPAPARRRPPGNVTRTVHVRLPLEDAERLERLCGRHGSITACVTEGLRALDESPEAPSESELAELRAELAARGDQLDRVRGAHRNLSELARERVVDEVYCPVCERLVPLEEVTAVIVEDGSAELVHEAHAHRRSSRLRPGTIAARRRPLPVV